MLRVWISRWGPAVLTMVLIFALSSRRSDELPDFGLADLLVKKGGHVLEYALLAWAYRRGLNFERGRHWIVWGLAIGYAITDEIHQSYVPGRHSSAFDVLIFDNLGAMLSLIVGDRFARKRL